MSVQTLATAIIISPGQLPRGNVALFLSIRGWCWSLVDIPVFFGHLAGSPAGTLGAMLSCGAGLALGLAWLLTAAAYGVSLGAGIGLRWRLVIVGRG